MPRFIQLIIVVYLGALTEISVDFLKCMARKAWTGDLYVDVHSLPVFVGAIALFILIFSFSVIAPERIVGRKEKNGAQHKITSADRVVLIAGFIVAVLISGAFIPSVCDECVRRSPASRPRCGPGSAR